MKITGKKVSKIEKRFGQPIEDILGALNYKGLSYSQQGRLLKVSPQQIGLWSRKLGLTPLNSKLEDDTFLMESSGLKEVFLSAPFSAGISYTYLSSEGVHYNPLF